MSTEANKALLLRLNQAIAAGRLGELEGHPDLWETRHIIPMLHMVFADWQLGPLVQLAQGPWVCSYGAMTVRHTGQFAGVAPTGRRLTVEVISVDRVEDGKVVAHNSASTWFDALPVLGARGFGGWPMRAEPLPMRPPSEQPALTASPMHDLLAALCEGDRRAAEGHTGVDDVVAQVRVLRAAFSELSYTPVTQLAEGDMVATRGTLSGTHCGNLYGLTPTGHQVTWDWYSLARIENGAIVEQRSIPDWLAVLRRLGILSSPTEAPRINDATMDLVEPGLRG